MNKPLLFYSNKCEHSKAVLDRIRKLNIMNSFLVICIESYMHMLPAFVDRVPLIYDYEKVYADGSMDEYLNRLAPKHIESFNESIGSGSHWMALDETGDSCISTNQYVTINDFGLLEAGRVPLDDDTTSTKGKRWDPAMLEKFMANRAEDSRQYANQADVSKMT
jgi:hypothetical protein